MNTDRTVKFTVRLNMLNPAHVAINKVLSELDMGIFKSKNQFFIDAATYFIENYGRETLTKPKDIDKPQYISTDDMEIIEKRIIESSKQEARQEANKEVMNMMGSFLAAVQANAGTVPMIQPNRNADKAGDYDTDSEDEIYDDIIGQNALHWMEND